MQQQAGVSQREAGPVRRRAAAGFRIVPGQYLAVDPKGRSVMIGALLPLPLGVVCVGLVCVR